MRIILKVCVLISALILIVILLIYLPSDSGEENVEIIIEQGQTVRNISYLLADKDLIRSRILFQIYTTSTNSNQKLQAGRYIIPQPASIPDIVSHIVNGDAQNDDIWVTIPEGMNVGEIDIILTKMELIEEGEFSSRAYEYEGYLFPDTYRFDSEVSVEEIIGRFKDVFNDKIGEDIPFKTVVIASILEKEVRTNKDMALVAGIINNRIKLGMPLQIDATVAYGVCVPFYNVGKACSTSEVNLVDNIKVDSPYNTYTRLNFPIGPISNAGIRAFDAVANPEESDYLFYLSKPNGETVFSQTFQQHEKARQNYLVN